MRSLLLRCLGLLLLASSAFGFDAPAITAIFNSATDVPVTANGYTATGSTVNLALNFAPTTGTQLMVVKNTALSFINGTFSNLAQGQEVALSFGGGTYHFVANYFGGSGNDLVLHWAGTQVWGWGSNQVGELGNNSTEASSMPEAVLTSDVLAGKTVIAVAAGAAHSLALCSDGTVAAWGSNAYGQLGNNSSIDSHVPTAVSVTGTALAGKVVVAVATGNSHSLALCSDGTVATWGYNFHGQLGSNSTSLSRVPVAVKVTGTGLAGKTAIAVMAGSEHSLVLCSDGTVAAWGRNDWGQLGNRSTVDSHVPVAMSVTGTELEGKTVIAVAAGDSHSLALCSDGTLAAWGYNETGELGNNTTSNSLVPVAVRVAGTGLAGKTVIAVAAGVLHNLALCSDGTVVAWGSNLFGALGDNGTGYSNVPVAVRVRPSTALAGKTVIAVSAGWDHSMVLCSDGSMVAWGRNLFGQLGNNSTVDSHVPVAVSKNPLPASARVVAIASGPSAYHSLSLVAPPIVSVTPPKTAPVLNKYTGLYEWLVQVKNNTASAISGFDLSISGLPSSVSVWNAVDNDYPFVSTVGGSAFDAKTAPVLKTPTYRIHHGVPVPAGGTVTVVVEFLSKARPMPKLNPTFTTSIVPSDDPPGKGGYGIAVSKVSKLAGRGNLVQFRSVVGSRYRLWYSVPASMSTTVPGVVTVKDSALGWLASPVAFTAYGTVSNWMDEGPPKTIFTPLNDPTRQYRVELLPVPIR